VSRAGIANWIVDTCSLSQHHALSNTNGRHTCTHCQTCILAHPLRLRFGGCSDKTCVFLLLVSMKIQGAFNLLLICIVKKACLAMVTGVWW
jgi:hypothetical protein